MYDNIGKKIKGLATVIFILEALAALISGIAFMAIDDDMIWLGVLIIIIGPVFAWISSWLLYGFGELIDKTADIARNTSGVGMEFEMQTRTNNERIEKIKRLRAQGLITEEEYQQAISREQISGTMSSSERKSKAEKISTEQELKILKDKVDFGIITKEEYQAQRAEIIKKL